MQSARASSRITSSMMSVMIGSSPVFGSSKSRISGSCAIARANPTRRRMPPDSSDGRLSSTLGRWTISRHSRTRSRDLARRPARCAAAERRRCRRRSSSRRARPPETTSRTSCARRLRSRSEMPQTSVAVDEDLARVRPDRGRSDASAARSCPFRTGPTITSDSPVATEKETPSSTTLSPKDLCRSSARSFALDPRCCQRFPAARLHQKRSFVRKKSATSTDRLPVTTARVVRLPDALRAARRVVTADAGDQREDQAEDRRLDEAGNDVVAHVQELERVLDVRDRIHAEELAPPRDSRRRCRRRLP